MQSEGLNGVLMTMRIVMIHCLLLLLIACSRDVGQHSAEKSPEEAEVILNSEACLAPADPEPVSISDLISNPERFEGKAVLLDGYYYSRFEHSAIYLSKKDPLSGNFDEGLWLYGISPFSKVSDKHVVVSGIFTREQKGHLEQWPGSICVSSVVPFKKEK